MAIQLWPRTIGNLCRFNWYFRLKSVSRKRDLRDQYEGTHRGHALLRLAKDGQIAMLLGPTRYRYLTYRTLHESRHVRRILHLTCLGLGRSMRGRKLSIDDGRRRGGRVGLDGPLIPLVFLLRYEYCQRKLVECWALYYKLVINGTRPSSARRCG